jgi:hypothetical protein
MMQLRPLTDTALAAETVAALRTTVRGAVLCPRDPGYDAARNVWNAMIDKCPALIAPGPLLGPTGRRWQLEIK